MREIADEHIENVMRYGLLRAQGCTFEQIREKLNLKKLLLAAVVTIAITPAASATPYVAGIDQADCAVAGSDVTPFLAAHDANVLRVGVSPRHDGLGCVRSAYAAGYRIYVTLTVYASDSPAEAAAYVAQALPAYAPYAWAVSIENEPDLNMPGGLGQACTTSTSTVRVLLSPARTTYRIVTTHRRRRHHRVRIRLRVATHRPAVYGSRTTATRSCRPTTPGEDYLAVWDATEPVVAAIAPAAIRVYGETSPWGEQFIKDGFSRGVPVGAEAIGYHCYDTSRSGRLSGGLSSVVEFAAWAGARGLPLWCSEMAPDLAGAYPSWEVTDTAASWAAKVAAVQAAAPDLEMTSYYRWPALGDY